jgi:hypothetical protein
MSNGARSLAGGGMNCLTLALEEKRAVHVDPVLDKCRTVRLNEEVELVVISWNRRDKEY